MRLESRHRVKEALFEAVFGRAAPLVRKTAEKRRDRLWSV